MIKAEMIYNLEDMRELARLSRLRLPMIAVTAIAAIATVYLLFAVTPYKDYILYTLIVMLAGVFAYTYFYINLPEKNYRRVRAIKGDVPEKFEFDSEILSVSFSSANNCYIHKIKFKGLKSCTETKNHFFINPNSYTVFIIRKDSITEGTPEGLREIFKNTLGNKFISKV